MDIYTYFFFSYGLTALIAFFTVGLIIVTNWVLQAIGDRVKNNGKANAEKISAKQVPLA